MDLLNISTLLIFFATLISAIFLFVKASGLNKLFIPILIWMLALGISAYFGFFENTHVLPPRFIFAVAPPLLLLIFLAFNKWGVHYFYRFDIKYLTILHTIRVGAEISLYLLCLQGLTPEIMTFNGNNYDLFSGLSAPIIYFFIFIKNQNKVLLLVWNIICLIILINTVFHGIVSAPGPFQLLAFDQPNIAVLKYPYIWIPSVLVPIVYYSHIISIGKLIHDIKVEKP